MTRRKEGYVDGVGPAYPTPEQIDAGLLKRDDIASASIVGGVLHVSYDAAVAKYIRAHQEKINKRLAKIEAAGTAQKEANDPEHIEPTSEA